MTASPSSMVCRLVKSSVFIYFFFSLGSSKRVQYTNWDKKLGSQPSIIFRRSTLTVRYPATLRAASTVLEILQLTLLNSLFFLLKFY